MGTVMQPLSDQNGNGIGRMGGQVGELGLGALRLPGPAESVGGVGMMVALLVALAAAAAEPTSLERATVLLLRALSYDRSMALESGELRLAVVYDGAGSPVGPEIPAFLEGLRGIRVSGRPIGRPAVLVIRPPPAYPIDWTGRLKGHDAVLVCPGIDRVLAGLAAAARELDLVVLSLEPAYVGIGASLGVDMDGSRLHLQIDPLEAKEQGAEFAGELLEIAAPVVRR